MSIKRNAEDLCELLNPISEALNRVQSSTCKIAECVHVWKKLEEKLNNLFDRNIRIKTIFISRYSSTVTPAHFAAVLISPRWNWKVTLIVNEKQSGIEFLEESCNNTFMPMFFKFQGQLAPFSKSSFSPDTVESMTDLEWWQMQSSLYPKIVTQSNIKDIEMFATAIASSAGVERTFSKFGLIQSKLRNQLGNEKASKLVFINQKLNSNI